jgi:hypothetical protein
MWCRADCMAHSQLPACFGEVACVRSALKQLRCDELREVLRVILAHGNYLNGQTSKGGVSAACRAAAVIDVTALSCSAQAFGFRLASLSTLLGVKATDGKSSLVRVACASRTRY